MGIIIHKEDEIIREYLFQGHTGLELESQRTDRSGHLSKKPHPFPGDPCIDRDFGEAQTEIGTRAFPNVTESFEELKRLLTILHRKLIEEDELLWPFSNPPVIENEDDIAIADYRGRDSQKTEYRRYLAGKYGRYKMTFSGIHFNYSFSEKLIARNAGLDGAEDVQAYNDHFYLELSQKVLEYGWAVVALLAASPIVDSSFYERGKSGIPVFTGTASLRCSEEGYWNFFSPFLDYGSIDGYADSIQKYVDIGLLRRSTELYYPVRIKNPGLYSLEGLKSGGIDHIELRSIDLNPFSDYGIEFSDAVFMKLFLIWLTSKEAEPLNRAAQAQALHNFKRAALYDWQIAKIVFPDGTVKLLQDALRDLLLDMQEFFSDINDREKEHIDYQLAKVEKRENRYAQRVVNEYAWDYINKGLERAADIQDKYNV